MRIAVVELRKCQSNRCIQLLYLRTWNARAESRARGSLSISCLPMTQRSLRGQSLKALRRDAGTAWRWDSASASGSPRRPSPALTPRRESDLSPSRTGRGMQRSVSARRHDVGIDPAARHRRLADAVAVIARDHDRIALGIDAGDDADVAAAAAARHHRDRADLRAGNALAVFRERTRHVGAGAAIAGV